MNFVSQCTYMLGPVTVKFFWKCACALLDIKGAINGRHEGQ